MSKLLKEYVRLLIERRIESVEEVAPRTKKVGSAVAPPPPAAPVTSRPSAKAKVGGKNNQVMVVGVPDVLTFNKLMKDIVGSARTLSSDLNEIAAAAAVNKGSAVDASDVAQYADGGSAKTVVVEKMKQIVDRALEAGYDIEDASSYIAGELARGSAMGLAALADFNAPGKAFWTADRGAELSRFIARRTSVSPENPTDFLIQGKGRRVMGYSAKSTASAASNFKNPGLAPLIFLAGDNPIPGIYAENDKEMERYVKGYTKMSRAEKKQYRELAAEKGMMKSQSKMRDSLFTLINGRLSSNSEEAKLLADEFLRMIVPDVPNPPYKIVYTQGITNAVVKSSGVHSRVANHFSSNATLLAEKSGTGEEDSNSNGIRFVSVSAGGEKVTLFTYRIKFENGYGSTVKAACTG